MKAPGSRRDVKRLSQVLRKFEGRRTITASRKTCVIWNCVHHARKHLRGRRPPRDSGGVDAGLKVFSHLLIAGLDDTKFSSELHRYTPARTYPSDSEARPVGSDKRSREGSRAHLKSRSSARNHRRSHEQVQKAKSGRRKKDATSREIVLRSTIFLIRKGALRPPAGSAVPTRRRRPRGAGGTQYYGVPTRWRRLGPVARGARADTSTPTQPPKAEQARGQNPQHI